MSNVEQLDCLREKQKALATFLFEKSQFFSRSKHRAECPALISTPSPYQHANPRWHPRRSRQLQRGTRWLKRLLLCGGEWRLVGVEVSGRGGTSRIIIKSKRLNRSAFCAAKPRISAARLPV